MKNNSGEKRLQLLLLSIITAYFAVLAYYTPQYGSKARLFPAIVLVLGAVLLLLKFLAALSPKCALLLEPKEQPQIDISALGTPEETPPESQKAPERPGSVPWVLLWLVGSIAVIYCLGILAGIFISTLVFFLAIARMKLHTALLSAGAFTLIIHLVFAVALSMRLYTGLWL